MLAEVTAIVQQMLGKAVDPSQPLMEAGLDSLGAVELRTALGSQFNLDLPATVTFDYPSAASLSHFLATQTSATIEVGLHCHHAFLLPVLVLTPCISASS